MSLCWSISAVAPKCGTSGTRVGDRFVFLEGWEEGEVKKNLGCEDFIR